MIGKLNHFCFSLIFIILLNFLEEIDGKAVKKAALPSEAKVLNEKNVNKRGIGHDFDGGTQITSSVLQYSPGTYDGQALSEPWQQAGLSAGYEAWTNNSPQFPSYPVVFYGSAQDDGHSLFTPNQLLSTDSYGTDIGSGVATDIGPNYDTDTPLSTGLHTSVADGLHTSVVGNLDAIYPDGNNELVDRYYRKSYGK